MKTRPLSKALVTVLKLIGKVVAKISPSAMALPPCDLDNDEANDLVRGWLEHPDGQGHMATKLGTYELKAFLCFYSHAHGLRGTDVANMLRYRYPLLRSMRHSLRRLTNNAGFFPASEEAGLRYAELVAADFPLADLLVSYQKEEWYPLSLGLLAGAKRCPPWGYLDPYRYKRPWSAALAGKRVLVVHPFADTIRRQYDRRAELFPGTDVLPGFASLRCIRAVQSIAGNAVPYRTWFDALDAMKREMDAEDYDVALIGCGAYGFHLAAHAKRRGKVGLHMASYVQLLFGIRGARWDADPEYSRFYNDAWVRPSADERPAGAETIEGGCYW